MMQEKRGPGFCTTHVMGKETLLFLLMRWLQTANALEALRHFFPTILDDQLIYFL